MSHRQGTVTGAALAIQPTVTVREKGPRCMAEMQDSPGERGLRGEMQEGKDDLVSVRTPCQSQGHIHEL